MTIPTEADVQELKAIAIKCLYGDDSEDVYERAVHAYITARQALKENTDKRYDASTPVRFPAEPTLHFTPGQVITLKRSSHAFIPKENAPHVLSPDQSTLRARLLQTARTVRLRHDAPKP
jgi:hypothetical protein